MSRGFSQPASVLYADIVIYMTDKRSMSLEPGEALHRPQRASTPARPYTSVPNATKGTPAAAHRRVYNLVEACRRHVCGEYSIHRLAA